MNRSKMLTHGALLTAIFIGLLLATVFVPLIEIVTMFILPIPFIIFAYKYDWKPSLVMFTAAILLSSLLATIYSLPITVLMGLGGVMIGSAMHKKLTAYETWARGTLGFVVGLLLIFLISQLLFNVNLLDEIYSTIDASMQTSQQLMNQIGLGAQSEEQLQLMEEQLDMLKVLLPVGIVLLAIMQAFVAQWIGYRVVNRLEKKKFAFPPFRNLQFPVSLVWIYFFALIISLFGLDPSSAFYHAINNVLVLAGLLMTLQGFSFIFFYAHQKNKSKALPIVCVIVTLLLPTLLLYLVRILGIIDIGFRLRDRISKGNK
ncbi:YybS family protein [Virgibacillus flavescens]|uniref:YybS family protein n=1 Tax=Virgibacillus flavescens TaxID=1611422 RepID=UPI003D32CC40